MFRYMPNMIYSKALALILASASVPSAAKAADPEKTSGQGDWVFRYRADLSKLPPGAEDHIRKAHGGFAVDRQGAGDIFFHLDGYGIIHVGPGFSSVKKIEGDSELAKGNDTRAFLARHFVEQYERGKTPSRTMPYPWPDDRMIVCVLIVLKTP